MPREAQAQVEAIKYARVVSGVHTDTAHMKIPANGIQVTSADYGNN